MVRSRSLVGLALPIALLTACGDGEAARADAPGTSETGAPGDDDSAGPGDGDTTNGAPDGGGESGPGDMEPDDRIACTPSDPSDAPIIDRGLAADRTTLADGAQPDATVLALGTTATIYDPTDPDEFAAQVATGFVVDRVDARGRPYREVFAGIANHDDIPEAVQTRSVFRSYDGGETFGDPTFGIDDPPVFGVELHDGRLLSFAFVPHAREDTDTETQLTLGVRVSHDRGESWQKGLGFDATLTVPLMPAGLGRPSGRPLQLADGTILLPYYLRYVGDAGQYRSELLASSDGGHTFAVHGTIAVPPAGSNYPEPELVELQDGTLYAIFRHHAGGELRELLSSRSIDGGLTFSAPEPVLISFDGAASAPRLGINPRLTLLANGVLVLSSGRPDNFVAISSAGDGVLWEQAQVSYVNRPSATTAGYGPDVLQYHGSSGNTGLVDVGANRLIQIGDNCANGWGCPEADSGFTIDDEYRVWRRFAEVVTPDVGKIDLASKVRRCLIGVRTNMTWISEDRRRARPDGAFDGSTHAWSSAITDEDEGYLTLELDRVYDLTRIGLSIRRGAVGSAAVYTSMNGTDWNEAVVDAPARTHRAIEYFELEEPVSAAFVKVVVRTDAPCDPEIGGTCAFLGELELYSTIDSFENDPIGAPPRGYTDTVLAAVIEHEGASESRRMLRLTDTSDTSPARVQRMLDPRSELALEFRVRPADGAWSDPFLFTLMGDGVGGAVTPFHFSILPTGALEHYDPDSATWSSITDAGVVSTTWTLVRVEATLDGASILVDGIEVATVDALGAQAAALDGYAFGSSGSAPVGGDFLIDDVLVE